MSRPSMTVAFDASCLIPQPLTGVGYYTLHLLTALLAQPDAPRVRLFASGAGRAPACVAALAARAERSATVRWPTRLKNALWTRLEWPPIEWFTGAVDLAHGAFHLLPAARRARRMATVFDLSGLRYPEAHTGHAQRVHTRLLAHAVARADALIAISESGKHDLVELLGADGGRVHVVYGGIDPAEFASAPSAEGLAGLHRRLGIARPYLIHLGTLEPRKNLVRLVAAYARVRAGRADMPLLVLAGKAGWGYAPVFEAIRGHGLENAVLHTGYLTRAEALALLHGAGGCVYPSLYEGFGLPVLEAMAAGVPVLTSNVSSLPEVIGDCGLLAPPEDTDAIAAGIAALLDDPGAARARADAARARAATFTWERSARALRQVYEAVAS